MADSIMAASDTCSGIEVTETVFCFSFNIVKKCKWLKLSENIEMKNVFYLKVYLDILRYIEIS